MLRVHLKRASVTILVIIVLVFKSWFYFVSDISFIRENPTAVSSLYIFNSSNCKILNLNPFDITVSKYINKVERLECSAYPPLTIVSFNPLTGKHILKVNNSAIPYYSNSSKIKCCIKRQSTNVLHIVLSKCEVFHGEFQVDVHSQFVSVFCLNDEGKIVYENMHASVIKVKKVAADTNKDPNKLNVLIIGIDSMSRLNFYRSMPKTAFHLISHDWIEMKGYNKIGDNTLPNMMAFLSGLPPEHFKRAQTLDLDNLPFIWKEFSRAGYATAYAEDQPLVSTFNCHLNGFKHPPTDHYLRDYLYAGELMFMRNRRPPGCIAHKLASQHVFDFMLDFVNVYRNDSFFGLFWLNQISHNNLNRASGEDENVVETLKRLEESGTINTTMVILLSDHGLRVGDFRRTKHGWYEDRLPTLFISIPEWYKSLNYNYYSNLLENTERLTSPYDLYLTMKHVLYGGKSSMAVGCRSCYSLFTEVSADRSCPDAGVSSHWCACHTFSDVFPSDRTKIAVADSVVQAINRKVANDLDIDPHFVCEQLYLRSILYIRAKDKPGVEELIVGLVTDPGGAEFESTVVVELHRIVVKDSISRLNSYGNESACAINPVLKLFCLCKLVNE